ncbi:[Fe-S]-dependent transcriptional repressor FeoC [Vagococcus sp. WN89Y]|uniref:[Fe-S]-dependent transcriptional repressor FeoC n=1 Tax=Vagococcus sp. WN89Y TaxID=3457258 RepID=UPI003FCE63EF
MMATLIDVRNLLALRGRMDAQQLSNELHLPRAMIDAMLERMEAMGKAQRIRQQATGCLTGSCKQCPDGKTACAQEWWTLR